MTIKTILSIFSISILMCSCNSFHNSYYKNISGAWTISDLEHINEFEKKEYDLRWQEGYYLIGFENHNHLWFTKRENRNDKSVRATYEIFKKNDTLKIQIEKSDDQRLEGIYDLYIDTLEETNMYYKIQLSLDKEETYLSALRLRSK